MIYKKIGLTDIQCSVIGLGCLHFSVYLDEKQSDHLVNHSIDKGINFFDTGPLYGNGNSQAILGKILKDKRKETIISTKAGLEKEVRSDGSFGVKVQKLTPNYIRKCLEDSLKQLGTDYIDLYQLHAFDETTPLDETLEELEKLYNEGLMRAFGVSNYDPGQLDKINSLLYKTSIKSLAAIECHYNLIERKMERGIIPQCEKAGISLMPYRALARGILSGQYGLDGNIPSGSRAEDSWRVRNWLKPETLKLVNEFEKAAINYNISIAQLAISWLNSKSVICSSIIGVKSDDQLDELAEATEFKFTDDLNLQIEDIISKHGEKRNIMSRPEVYFEK